MKDEILLSSGKLQEKLLPAIYFDTSVVIDYWMTEGMELPETEEDELIRKYEFTYLQVVRDILKSEKRISKVIDIRKKLLFEKLKVTPVMSPLSLLELMEWHTDAVFKQIASEVSGVNFIQKKGKKEIGKYLKKAIEFRKEEIEEQKEKKRNESSGLESFMSETWLNGSFAAAHGLSGLLQVNIVNFHLPISKAWKEPSAYAYLQLGVADIMHILLAQHLGCQYIASFDTDFARVKDIVSEETGISILISPEEILNIL